MPDWAYYLIVIALIAALRPFLWAALLTVLLWFGYRLLPEQCGLVLFGRYWKQKRIHRGTK